MKRNSRVLIIVIVAALSAAIVFFLVREISAPRPLILGENTQILLINYFDEDSNDLVTISNYNEEAIINILKDFSEKWTMSKSYGIHYGANDVILYISVVDSHKVKSICFERCAGYSTAGRGCNKYQITNSERALQALLNELSVDCGN